MKNSPSESSQEAPKKTNLELASEDATHLLRRTGREAYSEAVKLFGKPEKKLKGAAVSKTKKYENQARTEMFNIVLYDILIGKFAKKVETVEDANLKAGYQELLEQAQNGLAKEKKAHEKTMKDWEAVYEKEETTYENAYDDFEKKAEKWFDNTRKKARKKGDVLEDHEHKF